eukprot:943639-Pyramimonas_sp.AAC.2
MDAPWAFWPLSRPNSPRSPPQTRRRCSPQSPRRPRTPRPPPPPGPRQLATTCQLAEATRPPGMRPRPPASPRAREALPLRAPRLACHIGPVASQGPLNQSRSTTWSIHAGRYTHVVAASEVERGALGRRAQCPILLLVVVVVPPAPLLPSAAKWQLLGAGRWQRYGHEGGGRSQRGGGELTRAGGEFTWAGGEFTWGGGEAIQRPAHLHHVGRGQGGGTHGTQGCQVSELSRMGDVICHAGGTFTRTQAVLCTFVLARGRVTSTVSKPPKVPPPLQFIASDSSAPRVCKWGPSRPPLRSPLLHTPTIAVE